jgi:hypothetical protein
MLEINLPHVVAEVEREYARYESALADNDVATLNALFWQSPLTIRYGTGENLYGHDEIAAFRSARTPSDTPKRHSRTVVTTYGTDIGTVNTLFERDSAPGKIGRQSQTWLRTAQGWRVVAAHVSIIGR